MATTIDQVSGLTSEGVATLRSSLRGAVFANGEAGYDEARKVYNAMIQRRPAVVARCVDVGDVITAIRFAREKSLTVQVRGGGHNGGGLGTVDNGLVIDLSPMKGI